MPFSFVFALIALIVGMLIGSVGVGGVLLVPGLKLIGAVAMHDAIAACMVVYFFAGLVGLLVYARMGSIQWPMIFLLCLGAAPGAYCGALLLDNVDARVLEIMMATMLIVSGIYSLGSWKSERLAALASPIGLGAVGVLVGMGSALTGTGGPVLLIPILVLAGVPVLMAIGLAQVIQIPISITATIGNMQSIGVDWALALSLAAIVSFGVFLGAKGVHLVPERQTRGSIAVLMIAVGVFMLII